LNLGKPTVGNRVGKLEFVQEKPTFLKGAWHLK